MFWPRFNYSKISGLFPRPRVAIHKTSYDNLMVVLNIRGLNGARMMSPSITTLSMMINKT